MNKQALVLQSSLFSNILYFSLNRNKKICEKWNWAKNRIGIEGHASSSWKPSVSHCNYHSSVYKRGPSGPKDANFLMKRSSRIPLGLNDVNFCNEVMKKMQICNGMRCRNFLCKNFWPSSKIPDIVRRRTEQASYHFHIWDFPEDNKFLSL